MQRKSTERINTRQISPPEEERKKRYLENNGRQNAYLKKDG